MSAILVAHLIHEVNSFVDKVISLDDIRRYGVLEEGEAILGSELIRGRQLGAAEDIARAEGVTLVPTIFLSAGSGGPISNEAYEFARTRIVDAALTHAGDIRGVYLSLHGATVSERVLDVEGAVLDDVRKTVGPHVPIVASLDLHAHVTERMLRAADALIAYRTYPHVDFYETGERSMRLLMDAVHGGTRPLVRQRKLRLMASAEHQDTNAGPMVGVMELARSMESRPGVLSVSVVPTQPWMDAADLGWSAVVVTDGDPALAQTSADELGWAMWERREAFRVLKTPIAEAVREAISTAGRPVVLVDSSDGTLGGAHGDSNVLLRELLRIGYDGTALVTVTDPRAAARATAAGQGATVTLALGGALSPQWYEPLEVTARVASVHDGRYMLEHPPRPSNLGQTAVLAIRGTRIVVSEEKAHPLDESVFHMAGLDPRTADIVQVKSSLGFRAVYEAFAARIIVMDTPGPCDSDLTRLPFRHRPRPMWPWDPELQEPWPDATTASDVRLDG